MEIRALAPDVAAATRQLLSRLCVSVFGVHSPALHRMLIADALRGRVDIRIALEGQDVLGVVLAAPRRYWTSAPLRHWNLAFAAARARIGRRARMRDPGRRAPLGHACQDTVGMAHGLPPATWHATRGAWRIIFVGTAPEARGRGVGAALYRAIAADRPLVARIERDNIASIRLHASTGWRLFPDGDVVLAVHPGPDHSAPTGAGRCSTP
jgi:GNAT superfamily N-acetyltransferase